nr:hemagglutinin repeat-containing protein [uncultured Campylobacter sp.]
MQILCLRSIFNGARRLSTPTYIKEYLGVFTQAKKRLAALLLIGLLAPCFSYCEIIPDNSAPVNHRASVSQTPNAPATQIDIASPNDKGISINEYSKLNTPKEGTVFNNSQGGAISKTAGYIPPNPRLNRGEAKLIINQVNSPLPSNLQGNIEIAGRKADLIIANPSGINVNGATIINSSSTTLSTATPTYENGHLKSLNISKDGSINIGANSLNDNGDYLNVISNSLKLEGKIYANEINVVATDGKVSLKNTNSGLRQDNLKIEQEGGSHPKGVSIDSSALGGMYAGKINIISTKDGAGINNKGAILADSSLKIDANGDLINEGKLGSNGQTQIGSKTVSNQKGSKISASNLGIKASLAENRGNIQANTLKIKVDRLDNIKGSISSSSALKIEAKSLSNKDRAVIGAAKSERLNELGLNESKGSFKTGVIPPSKNELSIISADHISNIGGAILSNESYLDIKESLLNDNSLIVLRALDSEIPNFYNLSGSTFIVQEGLSLRGNNLRNESSKIISLGGALLGYGSIDNSKGSILSGGNLIINKGALNNEEGLISSKGDLALNLDSLSALGKLSSDGSLYLGLKEDLSYNGGIYASGDIYLNLQGNFIASQRLISNKNLIINAKGIKNESIIAALGNLALKAKEQILNLGSLIARGELITNSESLINKKALIYAQDGISLNAKNILNQDASNILSGGDIVINTSYLSNEALSNIISQRNLNIFNERGEKGKADEIINASSLIYARGALNIGAKKLNNRSVNEPVKRVQSTGYNIDFTCNGDGWGCSGVAIPLKVNAAEIKERILKQNPNISQDELNAKIMEELSEQDMNIYVLSLYKNTRLPGEDTRLYDAIMLNLKDNLFGIRRSKPHKKERLRQISYSINKEYITEDSLSKFMGSNIISAGDSNLNIDELNNDKSVIYAYNDLLLNVKSLNNRSLSLNHSITSQAEYRWKHKSHGGKGGYSDQKNIYYSQPAIASIIGAKKDIKGYAGDISNLNSHGQINSGNAPTLIKEAFSKIDYSLIGKGLGNPNALNLNKNDLAPSLNNEADMQDIIRPSYINNLFSPISSKFYNTFYVYSELIPDFSYMHNKLSLLYDKKRTSLNSSEEDDGTLLSSAPSLIYAGGSIDLSVNGDLRNEGIIYAGSNMNLKAGSVSNLNSASIIAANALNISAKKDIINASSLIQGRSVSLNAGRDIVHKTLSKEINLNRAYGDQSSTYIGTISNIKSTEGSVALNAARDISLSGASIDSAANLILNAAKDVNINSAKEKLSYNFKSKGGSYKEDIVKNTSSKLNAKDNILIKADGIAISGADINARGGDALLQAKNSINLSGDVDSAYYESEFKEKGFASKKSTTTKALSQSVVPTSISAKNIMLSSQEADINIAGSALKAKEAIDIQAGNNINISPLSYNSLNYKNSSKSSLGGLKASMDMHSLYKQNLQSSSLSSETGNINLRAKNDLSLISADISSGRNLNLGAGNSINILAAKEYKEELSAHKRTRFNPISVLTYSGLVAASIIAPENAIAAIGVEKIGGKTFTEIYRSDYNSKQVKEGISKLSDIKAAGDISLNSPTAFITSNMKVGGDINIDAKNLTISAAANEYSEQSLQKSTSVSVAKVKDILSQMKPKSLDELKKDTSIKVKLADASYDKSNTNLYGTKAVSSNMEAKNITLRGDNSLSVIGSNLKAEEDLNLISKDGNINIINSTDTASSSSNSKHLEGSLSLTVQNEYAQIAPAAIALQEAIKQLNQTKKQYKEYKDQKNALQDKLVELKNRYKAKEVGIDYSDIEDLQNIIEDVKDEEKYYLSNIALATANVASKTAALISQGSAASSSWVTWGFSVGASAELSGTTSKDSSKSSNSVASNLSGNNIKILTDSNKDTAINIKGSNLYASNDIHLSTHNLFIDASQDSYEAKQSSKTISGRVSATMYGGGGGSAGLDYSRSNMKEESLSHNNAKVYAGHNIYALASNDALIKGANLRADNALALKVGHDLSLASLRDSYNYDSKSSSIGAGIGISGSKTNSDPDNPYDIGNNIVRYSNSKLSSINANYSRSKSSTTVKQTVLSSITAKELNIEVGANTDLKGSLIAAGYYDESGNFIDNGKLRLKTDSLTFSNLSNTRYDKSNSLSIGTNYAFKDPQQGEGGSKDGGNQASTAGSNAFSSNQMSSMQTSGSIGQSGTSLQDKKNDTDPKSKISSINYANNRNLSYSMSKSLATIGKGELIVGDKDISSLSKDELASLQSDPNNKALYNSDDLTRLNRDSSKLNKELYSTKLNSNVDASVDMRLFSKEGRNEIKRDYEDASTIYDAIYQIATTDRVSIKDFFSENGKGFMTVNAVRQEIANNPELRRMLQSDELSDQEKQAITQNITRQVMINLGYIPNQTKTIYTDETGRDGKQIMGFYSLQTGRSYINIKNNKSTKDLVATSATESQRAMDHQRGINFLQNEDDHSTYSRNFGNAVARYYGYALSSYGSGYGSAKINNPSSINQNYYASNNKEFSRLDKQKGANRQLHQEEVEWLNDKQKIAKFKDYIQKATSKRYTDDEAKKILAKGGISLSDESFNEAYKESLSDDELADIGLAKEYIKQSDFYNKDLDGTNAFNPTAGQYWERYVYSENAYANKDFYIKNLYLNKGMGILDYVKSTAYGLYGTAEGYVDGIEDMGDMVLHPIDTVGNIFSAIIHPLRTRQAISDSIDEHQADNFVDAMIGDQSSINRRNYHTLGEAAAGLGSGKLASKLNKTGKVVGKIALEQSKKGAFKESGAIGESIDLGGTTGKSLKEIIDGLPDNRQASLLGYSKVNSKIVDNVKWTKNEAETKILADKLIENYVSVKIIPSGKVYKLQDGSYITIRSQSKTSTTTTIEINNGQGIIKIHSLDGIK